MAEFTNEKMEVTEDQLQDVSGGAVMYDPGVFYEMRFTFSPDDIKILKKLGPSFKNLKAGVPYARSDLNKMGIPGSTGEEMKTALEAKGIKFVL